MFRLRDIIAENRAGRRRGTYAVCSAHPWVIDTAVQQALENRSLLHIESTASQVNQFGGYSGNTPHQFATRIRAVAQNAGLASEQVLLGGDHVGPFPWRHEASIHAMTKASQLVRECVLAGYTKIHLDASMPCADDPKSPLDDRVVAERAAILCNAAEEASRELPPGFSPLYVIGTEVPAPGGESASGGSPQVTTVENVEATLQAFHAAFVSRNLSAAWERVIGLVVQPGVEFGDHTVFDYDRNKTQALSAALPSHPPLVFEAHSTDYQAPGALAQMVDDHFAILKVGPWLTFAFREAVFALAAIESEMLGGRKGLRLSNVREELERIMLRDPSHWQSYYQGDEPTQMLSRAYSYSDRCRYYWHDAAVESAVEQLVRNLSGDELPPGLVSQYLPREYEAVRAGQLRPHPKPLIHFHIRNVMGPYAAACGVGFRED
jgi:D-tagatose-1,6-bisphosphate aldolase subunit GatZ/KbaZ